jgi:gas vesicle protein
MNRLISWLQHFVVRATLTLSLVGIALFSSAALGYGNSFQARAEAYTPEAAQYQVNSNDSPFQDSDREKVNQLFQENKQPQTASQTTKEIGENLTKPAKTAKEKLEGAADDIQEKAGDAYSEQRNKPKFDIEDVAENIKEKLNLDQPIYPGTKEFLNDVQDKVEETLPGT